MGEEAPDSRPCQPYLWRVARHHPDRRRHLVDSEIVARDGQSVVHGKCERCLFGVGQGGIAEAKESLARHVLSAWEVDRRGLEWRLLQEAAISPEHLDLLGHSGGRQ